MNPSTTALTLNMQLPNIATVSWAVQGDQLARRITATLVDGSTPWVPDASYNGVVRYHKPDGTSGVYDVDEDGNRAVTWSGNVATITIAQQAITVPGSVSMQLEFYDTNNARLTAFGWTNNVQPSAVTDTEFISTDYYNILTLQISAVLEVAGEMTPYSSTPEMDGVGAPGTSPFYSRGNHVHPTDTSRASVEALSTYTRPNLLDNWYFVGGGSQAGNGIFPINQRGQTSYGKSQFTTDRWYNSDGGNGVVVNAGYVTLSSGTVISQKLAKPFTAAKLTMSVLSVSDNIITGTADFASSTTPVTFVTANNFQLYMVDDSTGNIVFYIAALANVGIKAVKVEIGDSQTLAHQVNGVWVLNEVPNYAEELIKCQRYYIKCDGFAPGAGISATSFYADIPIPVAMAKAPAVSMNGNGYFLQTTSHNISGINTTSTMFSNAVRITGTAANVEVSAVGVVSGSITLSAE